MARLFLLALTVVLGALLGAACHHLADGLALGLVMSVALASRGSRLDWRASPKHDESGR